MATNIEFVLKAVVQGMASITQLQGALSGLGSAQGVVTTATQQAIAGATTQTSSNQKQTASTTVLKETIKALQNEVAGVRNEYIATGGSVSSFVTKNEQLKQTALLAAQGLDRQSTEFKQLTLVAATAERGITTASGGISRLGLASQVSAGILKSGISSQIASLIPGGAQAQQALSGLASSGLAPVGLAAGAAATALVAVGAGFALSINAAKDFQTALNGAKITLEASTDEISQLSELALKIGPQLGIMGSEVAQGFEELGSAGLSAKDVLDGAGQAVTNLAKATKISMPEAAEVFGRAKNAFGITGQGFTEVSDIITNAANKTILKASDFRDMIGQGGAAAKLAGLNLAQYTAYIAGIAPGFSSAADAGTSFKNFIFSLQGKSDTGKAALKELGLSAFDTTGKFKPFPQVVNEVNAAFDKLSTKKTLDMSQKIFGSDSGRVLLANLQMTGNELTKNTDLLKKFGSAGDAAKQQANTLDGSLAKFNSTLNAVGVQIGSTFVPGIKKMVDVATDLLNVFLKLNAIRPTANPVAAGASSQAIQTGISSMFDPKPMQQALTTSLASLDLDGIINKAMNDAWAKSTVDQGTKEAFAKNFDALVKHAIGLNKALEDAIKSMNPVAIKAAQDAITEFTSATSLSKEQMQLRNQVMQTANLITAEQTRLAAEQKRVDDEAAAKKKELAAKTADLNQQMRELNDQFRIQLRDGKISRDELARFVERYKDISQAAREAGVVINSSSVQVVAQLEKQAVGYIKKAEAASISAKADKAAAEEQKKLLASLKLTTDAIQAQAYARQALRQGDGGAMTVAMIERTEGAFTSYQDGLRKLIAANALSSETIAVLEKRFGTLAERVRNTAADLAKIKLSSNTELENIKNLVDGILKERERQINRQEQLLKGSLDKIKLWNKAELDNVTSLVDNILKERQRQLDREEALAKSSLAKIQLKNKAELENVNNLVDGILKARQQQLEREEQLLKSGLAKIQLRNKAELENVTSLVDGILKERQRQLDREESLAKAGLGKIKLKNAAELESVNNLVDNILKARQQQLDREEQLARTALAKIQLRNKAELDNVNQLVDGILKERQRQADFEEQLAKASLAKIQLRNKAELDSVNVLVDGILNGRQRQLDFEEQLAKSSLAKIELRNKAELESVNALVDGILKARERQLVREEQLAKAGLQKIKLKNAAELESLNTLVDAILKADTRLEFINTKLSEHGQIIRKTIPDVVLLGNAWQDAQDKGTKSAEAQTSATNKLLGDMNTVATAAINIIDSIGKGGSAAAHGVINGVGDLLTLIPGIGGALGALAKTVGGFMYDLGQSIDEWLNPWKKAAREARELAASISKTLESGFNSGFSEGIKNFFDGTGTLLDGLKKGIRNALIQGFIEAALAKGVFKKFFDEISDAIANGKDPSDIIKRFGEALPGFAANMEKWMKPFADAVNKYFPDTSNSGSGSGITTGGTASSSNGITVNGGGGVSIAIDATTMAFANVFNTASVRFDASTIRFDASVTRMETFLDRMFVQNGISRSARRYG